MDKTRKRRKRKKKFRLAGALAIAGIAAGTCVGWTGTAGTGLSAVEGEARESWQWPPVLRLSALKWSWVDSLCLAFTSCAAAAAAWAGRRARVRARDLDRSEAARLFSAALLDHTRDALLALDGELRVVFANKGFYRLFQTSPEETIGRLLRELTEGRWAVPQLHELLREVLERGTSLRDYELSGLFPRIGRRALRINATPVEQEGKEKRAVLLAVEDLTKEKGLRQAWREAEGAFRTLAESANAGIVVYQGERFVYANQAALKLVGYSSWEEARGARSRCFWDFVHPDFRETVRRRGLARQRGEQVPAHYEVKLIRKDGAERWVDFTAGRIWWKGAPAGIGTLIDITERKAALERVQEYTQMLERIADTAESILIIHDGERILYANKATARMSGYSTEELLQMKLVELIHPDFREELLRRAAERLRGASAPTHYPARFLAKNGEARWVAIAANKIVFMGREALLVTGIDVTVLKETEARLAEAVERAEKAARAARAANAAKADFLAQMSHELRTPLVGILGMLELLLESDLDAERKEQAEVALGAARLLLLLIEDILDFARMEAGKLRVAWETTDLWAVAGDSLETLAAEARKKGIDLICALDPDMPRFVMTDSTRLRQILVNLLQNAVKHTPGGGEAVLEGRLLEAKDEELRLEFAVRDTGPGIPEEIRERLFEPFFRASAPEVPGAGLGLAISRQLAMRLGGEMWVQSEEGKGSRFGFSIVAGRVSNEAVSEPPPDLKGRRVIVFDPHPTRRPILAGWIARRGAETRTAGAPEELWQFLEEGPWDAAVLDESAPEEALRKLERPPEQGGARRRILMSSLCVKPGGRPLREGWRLLSCPLRRDRLAAALAEKPSGRSVRPPKGPPPKRLAGRILVVEDNPANRKVVEAMLKKLGCEAVLAAWRGSTALKPRGGSGTAPSRRVLCRLWRLPPRRFPRIASAASIRE